VSAKKLGTRVIGPGLRPPVKRVSIDGLGGRVIVGFAGAAVVGFSCFSAIFLLLFLSLFWVLIAVFVVEVMLCVKTGKEFSFRSLKSDELCLSTLSVSDQKMKMKMKKSVSWKSRTGP
jgi:hypothetical protein